MGVRITSTGISRAEGTFSIVEHSGRAARHSLERAGVSPDQVGVLINTGLFRDSNTVEPAISTLIQKEAGIGLDYRFGDPRSFSFDLMNGATGVLNAVQVAQSILETGGAGHVLVVSGDTHPSLTRSAADDEFPYATSGAALLLELTDSADGFGRVHTVAGSGSPLVESYVDTAAMGTVGRTLMTVDREPGFESGLLEIATAAGLGALADAGDIDPAATVLIASTPTPKFPQLLADALGIGAVRTPDLSEGDPHTAALPLAYHRALEDQSLSDHGTVLFVAAGAGPSAAAVTYRLPVAAGAPV